MNSAKAPSFPNRVSISTFDHTGVLRKLTTSIIVHPTGRLPMTKNRPLPSF
jgi:hypothetical protein